MDDQPFSTDQQEYLKGFMSGVEARRGTLIPAGAGGAAPADLPPDALREAQDRTVAEGRKLTPEERAKRERHPLDRWDELEARAAAGKYPKGTDILMTKYHGLFYVAPAQDSFMCRLRIPGGILSTFQWRGIAAIADEMGGGYADATTRSNLQIREIPARFGPELLLRLRDLGLTAQGSGADNVRNVTGSPTAGIDPHELLDTRADARAIHHRILHTRDLSGLPRKFNIAFDGGGAVPVLEDTNDVAFTAVTVADGHGVEPGAWYRLGLGGITGHRDFARPTGVVVRPGETTDVCDAILRVYLASGDRTDRKKARLKYVLDSWGFERFLAAVETRLGRPLARVPEAAIAPAPPQDRLGHLGTHPQKQPGLSYVGVLLPVGRMTTAQMRGLADLADRHGSGTLRLTVWQNVLVSDIPERALPAVHTGIEALGLHHEAGPIRAGLISCTGAAGCKFAASHTKQHALLLADFLEPRVDIALPLNIHLTGCHNSCAQHYIADIGLLGAKVERGEDVVEGYDLHVGGGAGPEAAIGRLVRPGVAADVLGPAVLGLLRAWRAEGAPGEGFQAFAARHDDAQLLAMTEAALLETAA